MRILNVLALLFVILCSFGIRVANGQPTCPKSNLNQGRCEIESLTVEKQTISQVLNTIAYEYDVRIGLELSNNDDLTRTLSFSVTNRSLTEVLDLITQQMPSYKWEFRGEVINFYPKPEFRDAFLSVLLETRINSFKVKKRMSRLELRRSLAEIPEIKILANSNGLIFDISAIHISQFKPFDQTKSFKVKRRTLSVVLNRIVLAGQTKFWVLSRYGEGKKILDIGL
ncbi:MAG: hypothetical protein IPN69_19140 [Acidobacteria bacterium]|nr:hypothetical protein [Acidobacteriota bacterium]